MMVMFEFTQQTLLWIHPLATRKFLEKLLLLKVSCCFVPHLQLVQCLGFQLSNLQMFHRLEAQMFQIQVLQEALTTLAPVAVRLLSMEKARFRSQQ